VVIAAQQLDPKAAYVACSRGKQEATVFTPEKDHLFSYLTHTADRPAAMDIIESSRSAFWKQNSQTTWQHARTFHPSPSNTLSIDRSQSFELEIE
jgi:hypothetical protein